MPERRQDEVFGIAAAVALAPALAVMRPALERFQAELERVPTADPALRSGRAGWRVTVAEFAALPAVVDVCGELERWRLARFALASAPLGLGTARPTLLVDTAGPKLLRAARRMHELGVRTGTALRFTGETLLDGIGEDVGPAQARSRAYLASAS